LRQTGSTAGPVLCLSPKRASSPSARSRAKPGDGRARAGIRRGRSHRPESVPGGQPRGTSCARTPRTRGVESVVSLLRSPRPSPSRPRTESDLLRNVLVLARWATPYRSPRRLMLCGRPVEPEPHPRAAHANSSLVGELLDDAQTPAAVSARGETRAQGNLTFVGPRRRPATVGAPATSSSPRKRTRTRQVHAAR
jgi:hypothetical protein